MFENIIWYSYKYSLTRETRFILSLNITKYIYNYNSKILSEKLQKRDSD